MGSFLNDGIQVQEYIYDFSVDGGVNGTPIILSDKDNADPVPSDAIVKGVSMKVVTAFLSGGSATLEWGNGNDQDGYSGTALAKAVLIDNAIFNGWDNGAALIFDDANDHIIYLDIPDTTAGEFSINIGTADLTAGKAVFLVEFYMPTLS